MDDICIVGIETRGVPIANRLADAIYRIENKKVTVRTLDISPFRDDLIFSEKEITKTVNFDFPIEGKSIILTDDVIYTGRTVRAALDAILSNGRAAKIQLAVLVDRGHRELPIRADYVGKNVPTSHDEVVSVKFDVDEGNRAVILSLKNN